MDEAVATRSDACSTSDFSEIDNIEASEKDGPSELQEESLSVKPQQRDSDGDDQDGKELDSRVEDVAAKDLSNSPQEAIGGKSDERDEIALGLRDEMTQGDEIASESRDKMAQSDEMASGSRKRPRDNDKDEYDELDSETDGEDKCFEGSEGYNGLARLLTMMEDYRPVIPDAVTDYYLMRSGFECSDVRVKRLLALATQRFVSNIAEGAMQYYLMHSKASESKDKKSVMKSKVKVLEMDDLSLSLADHGINVKKQGYYL